MADAKFFEASGDAFVALGTLAIACFTFTLWRSTHRLWQAGEDQRATSERIARDQRRSSERIAMSQRMQEQANIGVARKSAEAANKAADAAEKSGAALLGAEQAYPWVSKIRVEGWEPKEDGLVRLTFTAVIENAGRTPCFVGLIHFNLFMLGLDDDLPPGPSYSGPNRTDKMFFIPPAGHATLAGLTMPDLQSDDFDRVLGHDRVKSAHLVFFGYFEYTDVFSRRWRSGFAYRVDVGRPQGSYVEGPPVYWDYKALD